MPLAWLIRRPKTLRGLLQRMAAIVLLVSLAIWYGMSGLRARQLVLADEPHRPDFCALEQGPCPARQWAAFPQLKPHPEVLVLPSGLQLRGWRLPSGNGRLVLLLHGYRANATAMLPLAAAIHADGTGVLAFDLPGHGGSDGKYIRLDLDDQPLADALWAHATSLPGINTSQIAVAGEGLGGALALKLAMEKSPTMVLVSSPLLRVDLHWVQAHTGLPAPLAWWVWLRLQDRLQGQDYAGQALRAGRPRLQQPLMWLVEAGQTETHLQWLAEGVDRSRLWLRLRLPEQADAAQQARQLQEILSWMHAHWPAETGAAP